MKALKGGREALTADMGPRACLTDDRGDGAVHVTSVARTTVCSQHINGTGARFSKLLKKILGKP